MSDDRHVKAAELLADGHTQVEAADEVGVSPRTVRRWRNSGKLEGLAPPDTEADEPDGSDSVSRNGRPASNGRTGNPPATLSEARRRKTLALAERREMEAAKMRGELVTFDLVRDVTLRYRSAAEAAPRSLLPEIAELMGVQPREAQPILEEIADRLIEHGRLEIEELAKEHGAEVEDD